VSHVMSKSYRRLSKQAPEGEYQLGLGFVVSGCRSVHRLGTHSSVFSLFPFASCVSNSVQVVKLLSNSSANTG